MWHMKHDMWDIVNLVNLGKVHKIGWLFPPNQIFLNSSDTFSKVGTIETLVALLCVLIQPLFCLFPIHFGFSPPSPINFHNFFLIDANKCYKTFELLWMSDSCVCRTPWLHMVFKKKFLIFSKVWRFFIFSGKLKFCCFSVVKEFYLYSYRVI